MEIRYNKYLKKINMSICNMQFLYFRWLVELTRIILSYLQCTHIYIHYVGHVSRTVTLNSQL